MDVKLIISDDDENNFNACVLYLNQSKHSQLQPYSLNVYLNWWFLMEATMIKSHCNKFIIQKMEKTSGLVNAKQSNYLMKLNSDF